jgi:hypothetical protein
VSGMIKDIKILPSNKNKQKNTLAASLKSSGNIYPGL